MLNKVYSFRVNIADCSYIFKYMYLQKYIIISYLDFFTAYGHTPNGVCEVFHWNIGDFNESIFFKDGL